MKRLAGVVVVLLALACSPRGPQTAEADPTPSPAPPAAAYPPAPEVPSGELTEQVATAAADLMTAPVGTGIDPRALDVVAGSADARLAWLLSDLLRFAAEPADEEILVTAFAELTGADPRDDPNLNRSVWVALTDHLIAWDLPAPPGYRRLKAALYRQVEPAWDPFFADSDAQIDWRLVSWGGVYIDDRPSGDHGACTRGCIPALDDPALTGAGEGAWYPDVDLVFGVEVDGQPVAFPKNVMEVHEMVNLTIGSHRVGIPYCTLCGSAQAYLTDAVPDDIDVPVLRTSGLLSRSNKVMYDLETDSVFDTFTGEALSGPLQDANLQIEQIPVVTSTWREWKQAHPDTMIVARDGGIGVEYERDPLGGRDDGGPIFPVGPVDPRQPVQAKVLGVVSPDGVPIAFPVEQARSALESGDTVSAAGVEVIADAGGLRARSGQDNLPSHEAFWFAWSQFHPDTIVWTPPAD